MKFSFCKKQYLYMGLAALGISLALVSHVFAAEQDAAQEEVTVEQGEAAQEVVREQRGALSERIQNRIINLGRNMSARMDAAIDRFSQIISRMESRIEKLAAEGTNTARAAEMVSLARSELAEATQALASVEESIEDAVTSDNPRQAFRGVRSDFLTAAQSIRDAQTHLRTALTLIKEALSENEPDSDADDDAVEDENETEQ